MKYFGVYSEDGLGVFISQDKLKIALGYLSGASVKGLNSYKAAMEYARRNYNLILEQIGDESGLFPADEVMRVNRTYYKKDLKRGKVNYEF